jgi:signal transduction histidine kinase
VRLRHLRNNDTYLPVETKACSDGMYVYEVLLDASVPARLEDSLRDFLLSTSHDLRTPCHSISSSASLLAKVDVVAQNAESNVLLKTILGSTKARRSPHTPSSASSVHHTSPVLDQHRHHVLKLKQMQRGTAVLTSQSIFSPRAVVMEAVAQSTQRLLC